MEQLLLNYHNLHGEFDFPTFIQRLSTLRTKFKLKGSLNLLLSEAEAIDVKFIMPEEELFDILDQTFFCPNLSLFFGNLDLRDADDMIEPLNFAALVLKYYPRHPDIWFERMGGNREDFLTQLKFVPNVCLPRMCGEQVFIPGSCLLKCYVISQYLKEDIYGEIYFNKTSEEHVEFNSFAGPLRYSWDIREDRLLSKSEENYPTNLMDINYYNLRRLKFYYQPYKTSIEANKQDYYAGMLLALKHKGILVEMRKNYRTVRLERLANCGNVDWKKAQHMMAAYIQSKGYNYLKLHRSDRFKKLEREFFSLADFYVSKFHEDYVVYTDVPLMHKETVVEKKEIKHYKDVVEYSEIREKMPYPSSFVSKALEIINEPTQVAEVKPAVIQHPEMLTCAEVWFEACKVLKDVGFKDYKKVLPGHTKFIYAKVLPPLVKKYRDVIESGLTHEDLHEIRKMNSQLGEEEKELSTEARLRNVIENEFKLKVTQKRVDDIISYAHILNSDSDIKIVGEDTVKIVGEKKRVEVTDWETTEIEKMVTYQVVPLGGSLYRRIDLKSIADKQANSARTSPLIRRQLENVRKVKKLIEKNKKREFNRTNFLTKYNQEKFFFENLIHLDLKELKKAVMGFYKFYNHHYINYCVKYIERLKNEYGDDWLVKGLERWKDKEAKREHILARNPEIVKLLPVKQIQNIKKIRIASKGHNQKSRKRLDIPEDFHQRYTSITHTNVEAVKHYDIPDHLMGEFWRLKTAAIRSKLTWVNSRWDDCKRLRKNFRSPKDLVYKKIFLEG